VISGKNIYPSLNIFIVTGNQMFITINIWFPVMIKMHETAPSKTIAIIWVFSWLFNAFIYHFEY